MPFEISEWFVNQRQWCWRKRQRRGIRHKQKFHWWTAHLFLSLHDQWKRANRAKSQEDVLFVKSSLWHIVDVMRRRIIAQLVARSMIVHVSRNTLKKWRKNVQNAPEATVLKTCHVKRCVLLCVNNSIAICCALITFFWRDMMNHFKTTLYLMSLTKLTPDVWSNLDRFYFAHRHWAPHWELK